MMKNLAALLATLARARFELELERSRNNGRSSVPHSLKNATVRLCRTAESNAPKADAEEHHCRPDAHGQNKHTIPS